MQASYIGLLSGLAFSIVLVYLLIVVNFQSWLDPFIMISALPAALAGIAWFLFVTHTTLSVPALMGAIMCMGVATSNSILVVSFATEKMDAGKRFRQRRVGSRLHAFPARADDRAGHDHRHGAHGPRPRRRRRTKRSSRASGHWRTAFRDGLDAVFCPGIFQSAAGLHAGRAAVSSK